MGSGLVGAHGTLTHPANGAYTYVVNENDGVVQALNVGQSTIRYLQLYSPGPGWPDRHGGAHHHHQRRQRCAGWGGRDERKCGRSRRDREGGTLNGSGGNNASGNVLTNDTDVDNPAASLSVLSFRFGASEGFGVVGTLGTGLAGARGTLTLNTDGSYSYVVNENAPPCRR